ncbi:CotH family protein [Neolewinella antarctica]|uniref:Uncharacterized protein n=1 Tax=Neolewinella antarctica TaxID=442734 RepID=A0ABX0XGA7_9BACT|nr:hypothetical protein [Neolewinella antarctica]NJC27782.1 hypothetical protein [Neolewinella antarctica]
MKRKIDQVIENNATLANSGSSLLLNPLTAPIMKSFSTLVICLLVSCAAFAAPLEDAPKGGNSLFDRWAKQETLSISLYINMDSLEINRSSADFLPATVLAGGEELALEVAVRGRFRRRTCEMPPMKLKFAKAGLRALGLNTHNDFKLVTHCTSDEAGRDALLREQLAYELYGTINPAASFRTQLLSVTYVNTADGTTEENVAILIEDYDELQDRLALDNCKDCYNATADEITNAEEVALFQYMIGNADYCNTMLRNLKLMTNEAGEKTLVPYDFDFSGLVNADYASVDAQFGQTDVTDRLLKWSFAADCDLTAATAKFLAHQDTLLAQVENYPGLKKASKREITKYLKGFFRELAKGTIAPAK